MKNKIVTLTVVGAIAISSLSAIAQQSDKPRQARKKIAEAKQELREAKQDSVEGYNEFRKEAEIKISENQTKIAELRKKSAIENKESKEKFDIKVAEIEKKNNDLRDKINGCESTKTTMWADFKRTFKYDMEVLDKTFIEL